jgi:hypothetical protein
MPDPTVLAALIIATGTVVAALLSRGRRSDDNQD